MRAENARKLWIEYIPYFFQVHSLVGKGEIVESGTEDYLLSKNGFYKKLDNTDEGEKIC